MKTISVIIVDNYPIVRASVEALLKRSLDVEVVLETSNGLEVIDYLRGHSVDLVILDVEQPDTDGFNILKRIQSVNKEIRVLFLSSKSEEFYARRALQAGANGFISKKKELSDILNAVKIVLSGYSFFPSNLINMIRNHRQDELVLSDREITVLRYLANGYSNKEIAQHLLLSHKTISAHKANILSKLSLTSTAELIDYAKAYHLL